MKLNGIHRMKQLITNNYRNDKKFHWILCNEMIEASETEYEFYYYWMKAMAYISEWGFYFYWITQCYLVFCFGAFSIKDQQPNYRFI